MTKKYDRHYFDRWYRGRNRIHSRSEVRRKIAMAVATAEYFLRRPIENVLDIGAGEGVWLSHLRAIRRGVSYTGVEPSEYAVERFGAERHLRQGTFGELAKLRLRGPFDLVVCSDVLHYLPAAAQEELIARVAAALEPGGLLLVRDADAAGGWRFAATRIQERACALARRHWRQRFHYRSAAEWRRLLESAGFAVDVEPMSLGTPYANVLLAARRL